MLGGDTTWAVLVSVLIDCVLCFGSFCLVCGGCELLLVIVLLLLTGGFGAV